MSKADRERAARGELHRDGKTVKMKPCPFPGCNGFCHPDSPYGACESHSELISDVLFILDHTKLNTTPAQAPSGPGGLVLPGMPGFQPPARR